MAEVSLEFIQSQLQSIQMQLREIKAIADLDRRNTRSMYDNLAAEMARGLGDLERHPDRCAGDVDRRPVQSPDRGRR